MVKDKRVLKLIRAYLESGVMVNEVVMDTEEGTPQGGPLSPLLSNIMLDDLDKELEKRGHKFVLYADDCNICVKTRQAGKRVMGSVVQFLEGKLKLRMNRQKSKVDRASSSGSSGKEPVAYVQNTGGERGSEQRLLAEVGTGRH